MAIKYNYFLSSFTITNPGRTNNICFKIRHFTGNGCWLKNATVRLATTFQFICERPSPAKTTGKIIGKQDQ